MAREVFILQFDKTDEPNDLALTSIKLEGTSVEFKSIHPVTASDIYEAITGESLWDRATSKINQILKETREERFDE